MLNFKLIEKSDINKFQKYYDNPEGISLTTNILSAYLWRNEYNIKFALYNNCLIKAYFNDDDSVWGYCLPHGEDIKPAVEEIIKDAHERGQKPFIVMLTDAQRVKLETLFPAEFNYEFSPENQEYVYLSEDLINLSGRKFHAKRNHISKFKNCYPDYRFEEITNSNKEDAYKVMLDWCAENEIDIEHYEEKNAIREALDNIEEFKMHGGIVYVKDKAVAMTLGCEISPIAFDICFEKALREYDGIYAVINNEFAKTLSSYKYINSEEEKAVDLFFDKCFNAKQTYIAKYGEKIISALYLISASFNGQKAHYLCGASTHKDFRKQGIMSKLIKYALEDSAKSGDKYSFLFPANDNLYNYYQNFGYRENCIAYISDFSRNDLLSLQELNFSENNILKQGNDLKNFAVEYYSTYNIKNVKSKNYFALFEENENTAEVFYFEFEKNNLKNMINDILQNTDAEYFKFTHNKIFENAQKIRYGMVKSLESKITVPKDIYIGITLN